MSSTSLATVERVRTDVSSRKRRAVFDPADLKEIERIFRDIGALVNELGGVAEFQELDVRRFRCLLDDNGEAQRDALHAKRDHRVPEPRVPSRRRERRVREPAGAGS